MNSPNNPTKLDKTPASPAADSDDKTIDEANDVMPEMECCDGACGKLMLRHDLKKLECHHSFCQKCIILENLEQHNSCFNPNTSSMASDSVISCSSSDSSNVDILTFKYGDVMKTLDCSNLTYGQLLLRLASEFDIAKEKYLFLTWDTNTMGSDSKELHQIQYDDSVSVLSISNKAIVHLHVVEE